MKKAIVLLSGGLDSTVVTYYAVNKGYAVSALTIHYGQKHAIEIEKAKITATKLNMPHEVITISLPWKGSALLDSTIAIPINREDISSDIPDTYVPARNTIFLSFALSWAEVRSASAIFIGANQLDYSGYPDCREEYFESLKETFKRGTKCGVEGRGIDIVTPLLRMSKKEIIVLGNALNVPFEDTWSCYNGGPIPCAMCDSCILRMKGFNGAGFEDNLILKSKV